uniref:Uncharacterized protein n=1 Tax=Calcidiscus leptoporus TaxID=127549 RepID=A0A7S0P3U2_9EUKA|mmetsp:Transcript_54434/g.125432  ORF Transcript_54434/g.125432 Transcript_54434/m.125432 type:complete len:212 (+) Transcript_54434:100-735(+)
MSSADGFEICLNALEQMKLNERVIEALQQTNKLLLSQLEDALDYRKEDLARRPTSGATPTSSAKRSADEVEQHELAKRWSRCREEARASEAEELEAAEDEAGAVVLFRSTACDDEPMDLGDDAGLLGRCTCGHTLRRVVPAAQPCCGICCSQGRGGRLCSDGGVCAQTGTRKSTTRACCSASSTCCATTTRGARPSMWRDRWRRSSVYVES